MRIPYLTVTLYVYLLFYSHRDTVSSVGFFRSKVLPGTADGMKHVCIFRHALALDERRVKFLPEYVNEGFSQSVKTPASSNSMTHATGTGEKRLSEDTAVGKVPVTKDSSCAEGMFAG